MLTDSQNKKWLRCLDIIRDNIGEEKFKMWFECAKPLAYDEDSHVLTIELPSTFYCELYEDDFYNILSKALMKEFGTNVRLSYETKIIAGDNDSKVKLQSSGQSHTISSKFIKSRQTPANPNVNKEIITDIDPQLNPSLSFENYCVGESNKLAYTIADHIASKPFNSHFNPFFLYGDVGIGKTHLIQAIGIRVKELYPTKKVLFTTARLFQNIYVQAALDGKVPDFIRWFQQIDVLLIDDLQELAGKTKTTNDALFPIYNHLHQNGKQLVFTCDRPPMELDGIADRIIDRFKWGITERLPKPDLALRKNILAFKARKNGLELPQDVIDLIAENATESIREIEGIVLGILTRSIMHNAPITKELAMEVMKNSIKQVEKKHINFDMIVETTAEYFGLNPDVIFSKSRVRDIADARQIIMYLAHNLIGLSSKAIGSKLNREHTTVLHGISSIEDRMPYVKELNDAISSIESELKK